MVMVISTLKELSTFLLYLTVNQFMFIINKLSSCIVSVVGAYYAKLVQKCIRIRRIECLTQNTLFLEE